MTLWGEGGVSCHMWGGGGSYTCMGEGGEGGLAHGHRDKDNKQKPGMGKSEVIIQKEFVF